MQNALADFQDDITYPPPKPKIMQRWDKSWTPIIGHGCSTIEEMKAWITQGNEKAGKTIYKIDGLPKPPPKPKLASEPLTPFNEIELAIARKTLGLDKSAKAIKNFIHPDAFEATHIRRMVAKGFMAWSGQDAYLTALGINEVNNIRPISWGVVR